MNSNIKPTPQTATTGGSTVEPQATTEKEKLMDTSTKQSDRRQRHWTPDHLTRHITNTPPVNEKQPNPNITEYPLGAYHFPFLEHFFGDKNYWVDVAAHTGNKLEINEIDRSDTIRWSNADFQYNLSIEGNLGWLDMFSEIGLILGNSKKMAKRLQELVRQSAAYLYSESLNIQVMDPKDLGVDEKEVDGISAISRSFAIKLFTNNTKASTEWIQSKVKDINNGKIVIVSLRIITPNGLIKGNAIILKDNMMDGYDVRTFTPNVKPELRSNGWFWSTIEPSYGRMPLKTDDLTLAIYNKVKGIIDPKLLIDTLRVVAADQADKIMNGDPNDWLKQVINYSVPNKDDRNVNSTIKRIDQLVSKLEDIGLSIESSQLLMYLKANSFAMMYGIVDKFSKPVARGNAFTDPNGAWMPVPYGYRAHIMTRKALEIFGFKFKNKVYEGFYHEASHCFVVPSEFFIANYINHGGFDLDDTVNVMMRDFYTQDGTRTLCAFILRNPNDFGEWSVIPMSPKEVQYCYHTYGDIPEVSWEELNSKVPQLSNLLDSGSIRYQFEELPGVSKIVLDKVYSPYDEVRNRRSAVNIPGGTGATVLPKIVYYAIAGTYLEDQIVSNEQLIDAVQQGMASPSDAQLIRKASENVYVKTIKWLTENPGAKIDAYWAMTRIPGKVRRQYRFDTYYAKKDESPLITELFNIREEIIRQHHAQLITWANAPHAPEKLTSMPLSNEERGNSATEFNKIMDQFYAVTNAPGANTSTWAKFFVSKLKESDATKGEEYTDRKILRLWRHAFEMKRVRPRANWDKWLFVLDKDSDQLPIDWVVRAYKRLG